MLGKAWLVQLKSYARIADLIDGPVDVAYDAAGNIVSVTAPSLVQQVIKDAARLKHWNYKIPPHGTEWNHVDPPADQSDWIDVGDVHALVVDDIFLRDQAFALLSKASKDTKNRKINIMRDVDAPERVKASLAAILGDEVYPERGVELDAALDRWVGAHAADAEDIVNTVMARDDIVAALGGRKFTFKVFLGSEKTTFMRQELVDAAAELAEVP